MSGLKIIIPEVNAKNIPYPIELMIKICFALLLCMAFAMIDDVVESECVIFVLYNLYRPHPIDPNDASNTRYVATASLCKAGIAAGVIIKLSFFAYAKNDTTIARKPTNMSARCDRPLVFSTCAKFSC